jgi:hypothetical protein
MEMRHQDVLIDELQMLAVSVVALDQENLMKLYLALTRSYLERFKTGALDDSDAARAHLYATRAIGVSPASTDAYRLRGVCAISRFRTLSAERKKTPEMQELFQGAKADFTHCLTLDPFYAGGFFNLALVEDDEGNRPEAIRLSESITRMGTNVNRKGKEKYFADVYINWACFVADDFRQTTDTALQADLNDRIVAICAEGKAYLKSFTESLGRELEDSGDFGHLPRETKEKLLKLM